jgi:ABC-type amino acid transport substrate-binding protein
MSIPFKARAQVLGALVVAATLSVCATAHADATLDKIKERHKVVVGVLLSGGPFGAIDPSTQQPVGLNVDMANDLARQLGVEVELVSVLPANRVQFLQQGKVDLLIANMEWTTERDKILGHVATPFYTVGGTALVRADSDQQTPIVINCAGRTRSIIGAQTLLNLGIKNPIYALENGTQGWFLADQTLQHGSQQHYPPRDGVTAEQLQRSRLLGEQSGVQWVSAEQVRQWADDAQRSLFLGDVRTPEEFAAGSLAGAQHTPGGQLIQGTDLYVGVRKARIVLFDSDGVRAPVVASWLRQLGHEAYVLEGGLESGLALPAAAGVGVDLPVAAAAELSDARIIDLRPSTSYRKAHLQGAQWGIRPLLAAQVAGETRPLVLLADDPRVAQLAASELPTAQRERARLLSDWATLDLPQVENDGALADAQCIDFLFFVHDRHAGNKEAARQYLAWETGLIAQMTAEEIASFTPLQVTAGVQHA